MQYRYTDLRSFHLSKGIQGKQDILFTDFVCFLLRIGMRKILAKAAQCMQRRGIEITLFRQMRG